MSNVAKVDFDAFKNNSDDMQNNYLTFAVANEQYGIAIALITEIINIQKITHIPDVPAYIKGLVNMRGKIVPVMDVHLKFGKGEMEYDDRTCIIVVDIRGMSIGLIVDRVLEVVSIEPENVVPPPSTSSSAQNRYIKGVGKVGDTVKLLIDCDELFREGMMSEIDLS